MPVGIKYSVDSAELIITSNDPDEPELLVQVYLEVTPVSIENDQLSTAKFKFYGNYPNPFNPETTINFALLESSKVKIDVFNMKGQLIRKLVNQDMESGQHNVTWDGKNNSGTYSSSGIYLFKITLENKLEYIHRSLLIK